MWEQLEKIFIATGLEYFRQGSLSEGKRWEKSFFTFWNMDTPEDGFYDNEAHKVIWYWTVYYYTSDPATLYTGLEDFISKAKEAGFIVSGRGNDVPSGRPDYVGRMVQVIWVENL